MLIRMVTFSVVIRRILDHFHKKSHILCKREAISFMKKNTVEAENLRSQAFRAGVSHHQLDEHKEAPKLGTHSSRVSSPEQDKAHQPV